MLNCTIYVPFGKSDSWVKWSQCTRPQALWERIKWKNQFESGLQTLNRYQGFSFGKFPSWIEISKKIEEKEHHNGGGAWSSSFDFGGWVTTGWWRPASSPSTGPSLKFKCEQRPPHFPCQSPPERGVQWHLLWALTCTPEGTTCTEGNLWETLLHQCRPLSGCLSGFSWGLHELKFMLTWDCFYLRWRTGPRGSSGEECLPNLIFCPQFLSLPLYFLVQEGSVVVSLFLGLPPCPHSEGLCCSFH